MLNRHKRRTPLRAGDERLFRTYTIRIVPAEGHAPEKKTFRAAAHAGYTSAQIDTAVERIATWIGAHEKYGRWEWRLVQVAPNAFNFVYAGLKDEQVKVPEEAK